MMKQITITWTTEDIKYLAQDRFDGVDLTDAQAGKILKGLERSHDANEGINWDIIEIHISEFLKQHNKNKQGYEQH